jgi:hypothetical protein
MTILSAWFWLLLALLPLIFLERWVHRHLQGIWLLLFRDPDLALIMYSLLMLPGVILHEGSHWVAATMLGVRAGRFSVVPERLPDGTLRLGYVETEHADPLREALIGVAPLLLGAAAIIFIGYSRLGVAPMGEALARGDLLAAGAALGEMTRLPNFWLWLYLIFTISNSMLPSASDRRAWLPVVVTMVVLTALIFYVGLGSALMEALEQPLDTSMRALAAAFTITVGLDLVIMPFIWFFEKGLTRLTGLKVEYE